MGGHKPKAVSGDHAVWLSRRIKDGDSPYAARCRACRSRPMKSDLSLGWGLRACREVQLQKKRGRLANAIVPTWHGGESSGQSTKVASKLSGWSFIDETWTRTDMAPLRGWGPARGTDSAPWFLTAAGKPMTFLAALRHDRIDAPWFIEGPIDGVSFRNLCREVLLPTLRPGDIVVLDHLGKPQKQSRAPAHPLRRSQAVLLPKYSPT